MALLYKNKEETYLREIAYLHQIVIERENEVENIKNNLLKKIHDLNLNVEYFRNKYNDSIKNNIKDKILYDDYSNNNNNNNEY